MHKSQTSTKIQRGTTGRHQLPIDNKSERILSSHASLTVEDCDVNADDGCQQVQPSY